MKLSLLLTIYFIVFYVQVSAIQKEQCDYNKAPDKKVLVFRELSESMRQGGYSSISFSPDLNGDKLPYDKYVGKEGKILDLISYRHIMSYQILLEDCDTVYGRYYSGGDERDISGTYLKQDFELGKKMIGQFIRINQNRKNSVREQDLITEDKNVSYPLKHLEKVKVVDVFTKTLGHAFGGAPFFLKVEKSSGEQGFIGFQERNFFPIDSIDHEYLLIVTDLDNMPIGDVSIEYQVYDGDVQVRQASWKTAADGRLKVDITATSAMNSDRENKIFKSSISYSMEKTGFFKKSGTVNCSYGTTGVGGLFLNVDSIVLIKPIDFLSRAFITSKEGTALKNKALDFVSSPEFVTGVEKADMMYRSLEPGKFKDKKYLQCTYISHEAYNSLKSNKYDMGSSLFEEVAKKALGLLYKNFNDPKALYGYDLSVIGFSKDFSDHEASLARTEYHFLVPLAIMKKYQSQDISGQQLLNGSIILMDGERIELKLQ